MKINAIFTITTALFVSGLSAAPNPRDLGLKVKVDGKASYDNDAITQTRKLLFGLSLAGTETAPDLVVKWTIYGHSRRDQKLVTIKAGEVKAALASGKSVDLTTPEILVKGVREHSKSSGSGRRKKSVKVPASGEEYFGYAVKVYSGSTLLAEAYSQPSLKPK